ncbi:MAG: hypothetical protein KF861_00540 [Planctomycetaceae bacterium]|nr:hypothetical protein [Planctomycetaceae bacterium]
MPIAALAFSGMFVLMFFAMLSDDRANLYEAIGASAAISAVFATGVTIGVALLGLCDRLRLRSVHNRARKKLLGFNDVSDAEYLHFFSDEDSGPALTVRGALAQFFDVPIDKIDPCEQVWSKGALSILEPALYFHCIQFLLNDQRVEDNMSFQFAPPTGTTLGEYVKALCRAWQQANNPRERQ